MLTDWLHIIIATPISWIGHMFFVGLGGMLMGVAIFYLHVACLSAFKNYSKPERTAKAYIALSLFFVMLVLDSFLCFTIALMEDQKKEREVQEKTQ